MITLVIDLLDKCHWKEAVHSKFGILLPKVTWNSPHLGQAEQVSQWNLSVALEFVDKDLSELDERRRQRRQRQRRRFDDSGRLRRRPHRQGKIWTHEETQFNLVLDIALRLCQLKKNPTETSFSSSSCNSYIEGSARRIYSSNRSRRVATR